jgi:uncharacterized damage-inducible protein DinB
MEGIRFTELLDYADEETRRGKHWFAHNPAALDLPVDIASAGHIRKLLLHISSVKRHFAGAVSGGTVSFDQLGKDAAADAPAELEDIFHISEEAYRKISRVSRPCQT